MENKSIRLLQNIVLMAIAIGIWIIVLQNAGVISTRQDVWVVNKVNSDVDIVKGVRVVNTVDVNIEEINGHRDAFYGPNKDGDYDAIHVYTGN